jgi:hypothetical protein
MKKLQHFMDMGIYMVEKCISFIQAKKKDNI